MHNTVNGKIKKSVNNFVKELQNKITDLSSLREQSKKMTLDYERVCELIKRYVIGPPYCLNVGDVLRDDLLTFNKADLEEIFSLIGVNDKKILKEFDSNREDYLNTRNVQKKEELANYFQEILDTINKYIDEYNIRFANKMSFENNKIEKYKRYIELLTKNEFTQLVDADDFNNLKFLMSECSLEPIDKANILKYINLKNISYTLKGNKEVEEFDFKSHVYYLVNEYLKDDEYVNIVRRNMPYLDYETLVYLKDEGKKIAESNNLDQAKTINTLVAIAINSLYLRYEQFIENDEGTIEIESLKDAIKMLEGFFVDSEKVTIELATSLIVENEEVLNKYIDRADEFINKTVRELVDNGFSPDEAVNLKLVPILKGIKETLDCISNMSEYANKKERLSYLAELMDMYNETKVLSIESKNRIRNI